MVQAVQHISISRAHIQLLLLLLALSRRSFSKTKRNVTRHDSSGRVMKRESFGSGRVGLSRVNAVLCLTRPKPHSFFGSPRLSRLSLYTSFYQLNCSNRLSYYSISCQRKSCDAEYKKLQHIFFRVSSGATYNERGIERQNECYHLWYT